MSTSSPSDDLDQEIALLEQKLHDARLRRAQKNERELGPSLTGLATLPRQTSNEQLHALLLLADSALPLGSFAFSSGLESFLAHQTVPPSQKPFLFTKFLRQSLESVASTTLPYVLAAYRNPNSLQDLDNDLDASTPCTVSRRASTSQGRALAAVWDRSFRSTDALTDDGGAAAALRTFSRKLRAQSAVVAPPQDLLNAHLAPIWGVVTRALSLDLNTAAYLYLFSPARTIVSSAVRSNVFGPYQAQAELAAHDLKALIERLLKTWWHSEPEDARQVAPMMDLWMGRHDKLYSRIFNS